MKRPFLPVLLWYTGGVLAGTWLKLPVEWLFGLSFSALGLALLRARTRSLLLGPLLALAGWTNIVWRTTALSSIDLRRVVGETIELARVRGSLVETPVQRVKWRDGTELWRTLAVIDVHSLNRTGKWERVRGKVAVDVPGVLGGEYHAGRTVEVSGVLGPAPGAAAPGLFDYRAHLGHRGIYYRLQVRSTNSWVLLDAVEVHRPLSDRFVRWAQKTLARGLPREDEAVRLLWAMTLGWRTALTEEVSEPFMKTGTMHIFAISGLHVALVTGILVSGLRIVRVPRSVAGLIVVPVLWFYTMATGWQPSAIRSSIMMTVVLVGWTLRRPVDLLNSLAAAAVLILLWEPRQLFQAGFQLSFSVVLSMALLGEQLSAKADELFRADPLIPEDIVPWWKQWWVYFLRYLGRATAVSFSAWLGSMPLIATYFHLITPVSIVANLSLIHIS
ncbi:MAG: ComEC family competence protein, partial [Verrucomicrobiae bacterium]|nr:ComEC family competence protein [Verrucomicrobiae bacterium]